MLSLTSLKQELFPDFEQPQTTVLTPVPGTSTEVVDEQVTLPLVRALEQIDEVDDVTSTSSSGVSVISLTTDFGVDQDQLAADARDAIDSVAQQLPADAEPEVTSGAMGDFPAMTLTVSSGSSEQSLGERLNDVAVPELRAVEGVRDVSVSGVTGQRVTVTPDESKLSAHGLTTDSISQALQSNGSTTPAGSVVQDGSTVSVQVGDELTSVDDIKSLPLTASQGASGASAQGGQPTDADSQAPQGAPEAGSAQPNAPPVDLGDVASVAIEDAPVTSLTRVNGEPAVSLSITATDDADLVSLSADVEDKIADLEKSIGDAAEITIVSDQAPYISDSIEHLAIEGLLGLGMAVIVILIFLQSARPTAVSALSIPLSILITFIGLYLWGYSLNILTLGALTIAIGRVVDDSIVVIENIKRHLGYGEEKVTAILNGTKEVASAVTASTIATVLVFVPIALVGGFVGELFRPFALTVTIAMLSSLLVALTIVPVLSHWFLKKPALPAGTVPVTDLDEGEEAEPNVLQRYYLPLLRWTIRKPVAVITAAVLLLGGSLALIPQLKVEFIGDTGSDTVSVTQTFDSGVDIGEVTSQVTQAGKVMRDVDGVEDVVVMASLAGAGQAAAMPSGPMASSSGDTTATYTVKPSEGVEVAEVTDRVEDAVQELPNPDAITIGDDAGGVGSSAVDVQVTGTDAETMEKATNQVYAALEDTPKTTEVSSSLAEEQPTLRVQVDRAEAAAHGLTEQAVAGIVASAMTPQSVTEISIEDQQLSVYVAGASVETTEQVSNLNLGSGSGTSLRLKDVAKISEVAGPSSLARTGTDLVATVSLTPADGELGAVQTEVDERLDALDLPDGADTTVGGVSEQQSEAFGQLGLAMLVAVGLIFVLLVGLLRSVVQPLILMMSIPFAAIGSLGLLFATGTPLGVSALIGMLMLIGIVVTNAIVLMDLINQYRRRGQSVADAIHHGAGRRVRPVVMTALA
ncbi:MAG: efflux RND transporter permease subunit, partial [Actinomycetota bacterium]|nr:efflux RND transporter permease subunit [Actinomycetota bacterium]